MFSWKNIKDTYAEKVKNSESTADKTLGVLEVVGKSLVSGATVVVKELPSFAYNMADISSDNTKERAQKVLNSSTSSAEEKEKAQEYLSKHDDFKEQIKANKRQAQGSGYFDQDNIKNREKERFSNKITQLQQEIVSLEKKAEDLNSLRNRNSTELTGDLEDENQQKLSKLIEQISNTIVQIEAKIENNKTEIKNLQKRLEGY